ncbi:hypothetical protein O181_022438 [Austropuccinia psidii MF-1]|uniref:Uncharacterized protein n=1 Tax=Austropuccinia psidii MF-1 TaxID=1389203 RepID=A0A9Q3GWC4_9BASI|nr:hypothetical protein [Austropuccinia psidii MF-1]
MTSIGSLLILLLRILNVKRRTPISIYCICIGNSLLISVNLSYTSFQSLHRPKINLDHRRLQFYQKLEIKCLYPTTDVSSSECPTPDSWLYFVISTKFLGF